MKKYIIILIFICLSFIFMVSCGSPAGTDTGAGANPPANNNDYSVDNQAGETEQPAEEETPKNQDIFGAISEIIGNLATINIAVMPETGMPVPMNRRTFDPDDLPDGVTMGEDGRISFDPDNLPEGVVINEDGGMSISRGDSMGGGPVTFGDGPPDGFDPNNLPEGFVTRGSGGDGGEQRSFNIDGGEIPSGRSLMGGMMLDYTGEEKEFIIPVGFPIYALTRDDDGNEVETEIELTDMANGNVISITYKEDGKTIDKIIVSQITAMTPAQVEEMHERINSYTVENSENDGDGGDN